MANIKYGWWNIQDLKVKLEGVDFLFSDLSEESQNHIIELVQDGYTQGQIIEEDEESEDEEDEQEEFTHYEDDLEDLRECEQLYNDGLWC